MIYQETNALVDDFSLETFIKYRKIIYTALEKHIGKRPEFMEVIFNRNGKPIYCKTWVGRK